jgi:hypothetical protein
MKRIAILLLLLSVSGVLFPSERACRKEAQLNDQHLYDKVLIDENKTQALPELLSEVDQQNIRKETDKKGIKDFFKKRLNRFYEEGRFSGLAIAGFIIGIVGLIIFGIPFGIAAFTMGLISFLMIVNSAGRLRGKGFAIAAFILGLIDIIGAIIVLALLI